MMIFPAATNFPTELLFNPFYTGEQIPFWLEKTLFNI